MNLQRLLYPDVVLPLVTWVVVVAVKKANDPAGVANGPVWGILITLVCAFVAWAWITALWEEELHDRLG